MTIFLRASKYKVDRPLAPLNINEQNKIIQVIKILSAKNHTIIIVQRTTTKSKY